MVAFKGVMGFKWLLKVTEGPINYPAPDLVPQEKKTDSEKKIKSIKGQNTNNIHIKSKKIQIQRTLNT